MGKESCAYLQAKATKMALYISWHGVESKEDDFDGDNAGVVA